MSLSNILTTNSDGSQTWKDISVNKFHTIKDATIGGNLLVDGNLSVSGSINGGFETTSLVPNLDNVYNLGSALNRWQDLYLGTDANINGDINIDGTINLTAVQCIQAVGTIFTTGTIEANTSVNSNIINAQGASNQLLFTQSSGSNIATTINSTASIAPRIYTIPDMGADGNIMISDNANNLTVNQLNYTTLNPAIPSSFSLRSYLYRKNVPVALPIAGQEIGLDYETAIFEDASADITNNHDGGYTINNTGKYLFIQSIKVLSAGSNIGSAFALNGDAERYGISLSGSDVNYNGQCSSSQVFNVVATDIIFVLASSTVSSAGQNIGGAGADSSYLSIVRLQ